MDSHSCVHIGTGESSMQAVPRGPLAGPATGVLFSAAKMLGLLAGTFRTGNLARIKAGFLIPADALVWHRGGHGQETRP